MEYPRPVMSVKELGELGHSVTFLRELSRIDGCPCYKLSPKPNSKIYFYTDKLDAFIEKTQKKVRR